MPSLKDLRYRAEYAALRLVEALLRAVPLDLGVNFSAKAWRLIARFDRRHQRALDNLAIAFPQKTAQERQAIALAMWENLGRIMAFVRDGGRLGIVCDLHDRTGLPVPFFGKPARSVTIPAMIARRLGARIW